MNREEIKAEIVRLISENWTYYDDETHPPTAEAILRFLEGIGFDGDASYLEWKGWTTEEIAAYKERDTAYTVYAHSDPNASWNQPK